ncbi:metalloprotease [Halobaculum sp. MBLA0143]|uniref:metalloprotease n=1 Tax=Halobaculum sp. MBLA0143 TaxID=3079933 RepID=UPI003524691F
MSGRTAAAVQFSRRELADLAVAWIALSVAFGVFFYGGGRLVAETLRAGRIGPLVEITTLSALTAGVGFLLHELGHKVVAVRFGQRAAFRADYGMLFLAVVSALAGFLFAAPGAVHHSGRITRREHGLIALAGPVVNLGLAALFCGLWIGGGAADVTILRQIGQWGLAVNLALAAFNMLPFGPLDGATIRDWSTVVWVAVTLPAVGLAALVLLELNLL